MRQDKDFYEKLGREMYEEALTKLNDKGLSKEEVDRYKAKLSLAKLMILHPKEMEMLS